MIRRFPQQNPTSFLNNDRQEPIGWTSFVHSQNNMKHTSAPKNRLPILDCMDIAIVRPETYNNTVYPAINLWLRYRFGQRFVSFRDRNDCSAVQKLGGTHANNPEPVEKRKPPRKVGIPWTHIYAISSNVNVSYGHDVNVSRGHDVTCDKLRRGGGGGNKAVFSRYTDLWTEVSMHRVLCVNDRYRLTVDNGNINAAGFLDQMLVQELVLFVFILDCMEGNVRCYRKVIMYKSLPRPPSWLLYL